MYILISFHVKHGKKKKKKISGRQDKKVFVFLNK